MYRLWPPTQISEMIMPTLQCTEYILLPHVHIFQFLFWHQEITQIKHLPLQLLLIIKIL